MKTISKTAGQIIAVFFYLAINSTFSIAQAPGGEFNFFGRGMYVDKLINVYKDAGNIRHVDDVYSVLGEGLPFDNTLELYTREKDLLEYCKANHITYLVLYDLPVLFANTYSSTGFLHSNGASLEANLCRFLQSAKDNYCIESFGAAIGRVSEYQGIADFNALIIPPLPLTLSEQALIGNISIISAIQDSVLRPGDPLFDLIQHFRLSVHISRFNILSGCPDFDIFTTEYEFWHSGYGTWAGFTTLVNFLTSNNVKIEGYTFDLFDAGASPVTEQGMADYMDGTSTPSIPRKVGRILESVYKWQNSAITNPFSANSRIVKINSKFKTPTTNTFTVIHPSFTCETGSFYEYLNNSVNYQGYWMLRPALQAGVTPDIARNIFTIEKYYYDDWRTSPVIGTDTISDNENRVRPGGTHWYTSSLLKRYFSNPAIIYRTDQNACVSTSADVQFSYCGPVEKNTRYTLKIYTPGGALFTTIGPNFVNKIEDYPYSTIATSSIVIDPINLFIPGVPTNSLGTYRAEMTLDYFNHNGLISCGTYTYNQNFWIDAQPHVILNGDIGGIHNVCSDDYVILIASVNIVDPNTNITWYRRPTGGGTSVLIGHGENYTLDYYDYDTRYPSTTSATPGSYDFYYTVDDVSCGGLTTSDFMSLTVNNNSQLTAITSVCDPGTDYAILSVASVYPSATYLWSDGSITSTINGYHGGKYSVLVTQENGCTRMETVNVPGSHTLSYTSNGSGCNYTITDTYGVGGDTHLSWYRYDYSTASWVTIAGVNHTINVTQPGYYTAIYTTGTDCRGALPIYVGPVISNATVVNSNCSPVNNGSITLLTQNVSTFTWSPNISNSNIATNLIAGNYSVNIVNGTCTVPYTYAIGNSNVITSIIQSQTPVLCIGQNNGEATVLPSGGTIPYVFSWDDNETTAHAIHLTSGTHNCLITDANGCQGTATVFITEPPAISITSATTSLCIGSNQNTITTSVTGGTGAYTYLWQPGLETTPGLSNLSQGNYGVTVLDQNGCSSTFSNITFTENQNCCGNLNNQMLNAPGPLVTGSTYSGNNNLSYNATVTGTVTFSACTLKVAKNVSITVNSGSTLNIVSGSILEACGDMWKGIIVEPGGTLNITNSTILDAENGALLRQNIGTPSSVTIENSSFGSNYIGIYMEPTTNQGFNAISLHLTNVTFDKPHPLKPSANYLLGTTPYAGIQLNNWSGVIGKYGSTGNIYRNLNSGLRMNNCVVTVYAAQYINIIADPIYSGLFKGVGIFAEGGNSSFLLKEYGFGQSGLRSFENCDYGIYSQGMPVQIIGNLMENVRNGISLSNLPDGTFSRVQVNTINCIYTGITSQYHKEINGLLISGNIINVNNTTGINNYGVGIGSYDYKKGSNTTIFANQINMGNGATGIEMWGVMGNAVYGNEIDFQLSSGTAISGLSASASDKNIISCNNVYGNTGTADVKQYGYYFGLSKENEVSCNSATEINYGFEFDGICNMANRYIGNTMRNNWTGLNFNSDGQIDEQWHRGNRWDNANGTFSSGYDAQNIVNFSASPFYVNPGNLAIFNPINPNPNPGWFFPDQNGDAFDCETQNVCGTRDNGDPTDMSALEMMIANNTYNPADFPDESKWMARIFLFQKLMQQPDALSNPELLAFYNANLNGNIDKINQIREQTAALYNKSSSDSTLLVNNDSLLQATMLSIENCEKSYSDGSITEQQYISTVTNLKQVISNIVNSSKQIMALVKTQKDQTADNIRFFNAAVSTTEHYEANEKFVNDLYLRTAAKDNMQIDASDQSPLLSIAHECPFLGGEAVILARILYRLVNPLEEYNDYPLCHSLGLMRHRSPETKSGMESLIYPNPADNTATLVYSLENDSKTSLQIFDSSLRLIRSEFLNVKERKRSINLETLTPGLYLYNIIQENHVISSGKFSVVH